MVVGKGLARGHRNPTFDEKEPQDGKYTAGSKLVKERFVDRTRSLFGLRRCMYRDKLGVLFRYFIRNRSKRLLFWFCSRLRVSLWFTFDPQIGPRRPWV